MRGQMGWMTSLAFLGLAVLVVFTWLGCANVRPKVTEEHVPHVTSKGVPQFSPAAVEQREYPVLCDYLRNEPDSAPEDGLRILVATLVFNDHHISPDVDLPEQLGAPIAKSVLHAFRSHWLELSFFDSSLFKCKGINVTLVSPTEVRTIYKDNLKKLETRRGREQITIRRFSRVVFDADSDSAYLVVAKTRGGLSGKADFVWMAKGDGGWKIKKWFTYLDF